MSKKTKSGKKNRKQGRNTDKCQRYRIGKVREKNKKRKEERRRRKLEKRKLKKEMVA